MDTLTFQNNCQRETILAHRDTIRIQRDTISGHKKHTIALRGLIGEYEKIICSQRKIIWALKLRGIIIETQNKKRKKKIVMRQSQQHTVSTQV